MSFPRVLVTGIAGGIGAAISAVLQSDGWEVVGTDVVEPRVKGLQEFVAADLADPDATAAVVERLASDGLDALVNNAATQATGTVLTTDPDTWDRSFAVNVRAPYLAIRAAHEALRKRTGAVVNVASVHAVATSAGRAAYAASKSALVGLTRAAALELADDGVRVNAVLPGAIDTPMLRAGLKAADVQLGDLERRTPLRRVGNPNDVAQAVSFLIDSHRAAFITGQMLVVDGGALARLATE